MPRSLPAGIVAALTIAAPAFGAEVDDFVGRPVAVVELRSGGAPLRDQAALEMIETRVGQPLSMRQVRESVTHLFSLGRFAGIEVEGSLLAGGVLLRYLLEPLRLVERVEVTGRPGLSTGDVRRAIRDAHGPSFPVDQAEAAAATVRGFYRQRGFLRADVQTRVEDRGAGRVLRVEVQAGARARIERVVVRLKPAMMPMAMAPAGDT